METAGIHSSITTQIGGATAVGGGAIMFFGQTITQVQIALASMVVGAVIGIAGLAMNTVFKWLAHKEQCRLNDVIIKAKSNGA